MRVARRSPSSTNGNGALSFEEWAAKTIGKFQGADKDRNGPLTQPNIRRPPPPPPSIRHRAVAQVRHRRKRPTIAMVRRFADLQLFEPLRQGGSAVGIGLCGRRASTARQSAASARNSRSSAETSRRQLRRYVSEQGAQRGLRRGDVMVSRRAPQQRNAPRGSRLQRFRHILRSP